MTTGSQQSLYLVGDVLLDPGDIVIAASPSYFVYTGALDSLGAKVLTVPMDDEGMDVEAVGTLLAKLESEGRLDAGEVRLLHQLLPKPDRPDALAGPAAPLAGNRPAIQPQASDLILEDAAYRELRYDGAGACDRSNRIDAENRYVC